MMMTTPSAALRTRGARALRRSALVTVAALVLVACQGGGAGSGVAGSTPATHDEDHTSAGPQSEHIAHGAELPETAPVDEAQRARLVDELSAAFERVRSGPVQIDLEMIEVGTPSVATVRVDQLRGLVDSSWVQTTRRGNELTTLNLVVDGRFFVKSTADELSADVLDYYEGGERSARELVENAFTAFGRIGRSLDRLLLFVQELPFEIAIEPDGRATRTTVVIQTDDLAAFYAATGLETVGTLDAHEPIRLDFVVDDGWLVGIDASGTQFHDGEALDLTASLRYQAIDGFDLEIPPLQE